MIKKRAYPSAAFLLVFAGHALFFGWQAARVAAQWTQTENTAILPLYFKQREYFLSFSYALTAAFTVYCLMKFIQDRKHGGAGVLGGLTLAGGLYAGGCFLLGCCGSPMLAVYLGLFGASFLAFAKPLIAAVTAVSVILGYFWLERKGEKCCGDAAVCADEAAGEEKIDSKHN